MSLDRHRRDEARAVDRRVAAGIGDVGVGVHLALGDRGLADVLDRAGGQGRRVVGEIGARASQRDGAIDGEDLVRHIVRDLRRDAALDPDAQDRPVAVDHGDDGIVQVGGRRGALQECLHVAGREHLVGQGWREGSLGLVGS